MKGLFLILPFVFICGCNSENKSNFDQITQTGYSEEYTEQPESNIEKNQQKEKTSKATKLYKIKSSQFNMLFAVMPIPGNWEIAKKNKDQILFENQDGLKVYGERFSSFSYSNNQQMNHFYRQGGSKVQPPKTVKQIINQDIKPVLESNGLSFVGMFEIPKLAQKDTQFDKSLFKSVPEQKTYTCVATEWKDNNGGRSIGIIRYFTNYYTGLGSMDWGYTINALEAPEDIYEQSKSDYINALLNLKVNPNWIQRNNQHYTQKSGQSAAQHQQRMAAINAQGQNIINNGNTYSSILDSSHESWKRRNAMNDAGHSNTINSGIWERTTMNDQSGNQYQVEGYYNNVWKGNDDQFIGTDDYNWNPNVDNSTNQINWEQLEYSDDNY